MNGLNKITERIAKDTHDEISAIQAQVQEKCREIKSEYDRLAQDEYARIVAEGKKDIELQAQRLSRAAALEAKKTVLAMKQETVSSVLEEALDKICNLPGSEYEAFLSKLASEAAFTGEDEIILNARDRAAHSKAVLKDANDLLKKRGKHGSLKLSETVGDFKGGLIVKSGDIVANCTVETLVAISRDRLSSQIAEVLFDE